MNGKSKIPSAWRTTASRVVHADRWIHLRADDCARADGVEIKPWYVLEYPDWAQVVALTDDGRIVLVRQYRHAIGRVTLELPSGCVDAGDADPCAAGARELIEETGYECRTLRHVGTTFVDPAHCTNRVFVLLGEGARRVRDPRPDATEEIVVETMAVDDVMAAARNGGLHHAAQVASLFLALSSR